jgi:acyl transferase domain-containing protein/thioesterase domain-containing protein/acyl carrier protein
MPDNNDIAIIGMALRVPGASTPEQFWDNLRDGFESLQVYPEEQLRAHGVPAAQLADPNYVPAGMPLQDFDQFDPEFFGFSPKEAAILDPQHRQFYEVAWEALERAGCVPEATDGAIGVFAGCGMGAYFSQNILRNADLMRSVGLFLLRHTGNDKDFLATRVSYAFDLKGPSINVQTACSTSLVATHLAVQSLLSRETDVALAGGVTIEIPHGVGYVYHEGEILSPDGHCRSFDHRSRGTVFGSGVAVVVLKRLDDALRDGDHVHAVIKGSAVNNDGASKVGYLAPSVEGQAAAIAEAIALAGLEAGDIGYVECHGTGTQMGDPIEVAALTQAFRESSSGIGNCLIGSVKSNIGHLDTAAGVAGLIKAVLALEHEAIPPSLNFEAPNPSIPFDGSPFRVAASLTPWPRTPQPRRAAVNSLGVGGTNAFVVVEEAPERARLAATGGSPQVLTLSARSRKALDDYAQRLASWLRARPDVDLAQVAVSLARGRRAFDQRRVLAVRDTAEAIELLEKGDARRVFTLTQEVDKPSVVFMFPGGGAQYAGMGRALYQSEPAFRDAMDRGLALLLGRFGVDLRPVFATDPVGTPAIDAALNRPSIQLPLVFLIELSMVALWRAHGLNPDALIGHSMGENAAACAAGVFSLEDGLGLVLLRGRLMDDVPDGGMLSVPMAASELSEILGPDLDLAAANGPTLSIASGPRAALEDLAARLAARGIESRRVRIDIAAHSRMLEGILAPFRDYLRGIRLNPPTLPIVSNHTGTWLTPAEATDPDYWVRHLRNTVLFNQGVQLLLERKDRVFLEVGPGSILSSFVRQSHDAPVQRVLGSLRHPEDPAPDDVYFRTVLGRLAAMGVPVDRQKVWPAEVRRRPMPTYAFQHARYWIEPTAQDLVAQDDQDLVPPRLDSLADWLAGPRWVQRGIFESAKREPLTWCVLHDRDPLAQRCIAALRGEGHRVVEVVAGDTFSRVDDETYTLAPEGGASVYLQLIEALVAADRLPDRILHTWLLTRREVFRPGKTFLHRNQEFGFYSLFYLARAFAKRGAAKRSHWIVVGNGSVSLGGERARYPDKATVLGACAVIPRELPSITCNYVDLHLPVAGGDARKGAARPVVEGDVRIGQGLLEELHAPPANGVTAWRDRVRWVRYLAPHRSKSSGKSVPIRERGVYLITGGFGGVAGIVADWLAREYRARLVLLSRTPLPPRPDWDAWIAEHGIQESISLAIRRIRELEDLGAEVLPIAADVAVGEQVEEAIQAVTERFGTLHGVFHAAGVLRDGLIALKTEREIEEVFAAKLYGSLVLDRACRTLPMDFMILFSSVSAYVAPVGQIDYVAANSFLNAFAEFCHGARPYPVVAINWGIWKDVGMVASPHSTQAETDPARAELARSSAQPVGYPLFRARHVSNQETVQVHWISGEIPAGHWIADEHRLLRGDSLVPATGYVEFFRAALAELGEPATGWKIASLMLLQPFYVEDGQPRPFRVSLRGHPGRWRVQCFVDFGTESEENWQLTATARVLPAPDAAPGPLDVAGIEARCAARLQSSIGDISIRTRQEAHLHFGSRWRVLRRIQFGNSEALAWLKLPEPLAGELADFPIHPGLLDIATGCAMDLIPGYAAQEVPANLWVPVGYGSFQSLGPMPDEFLSWIRVSAESSLASGSAAFDVVLADLSGRPFAVVERLSIRQLKEELPRQPVKPATPEGQGKPQGQGPAERALAHNRERGIQDAEGIEIIRRVLGCIDRPVIIASSFRPQDLVSQADAVSLIGQAPDSTRFARPEMETSFEAPRDEIERSLAELWGGLLGVEGVGIRDSFFDLGGHSLVAVRLFNEIADKYGVDLPMSVLMQHPDVASLAERIRGGPVGSHAEEKPAGPAGPEVAEEPFRHVVAMQTGTVGAGTPLFIVSGMFGNVLNLSHMAHLLGEDRPFLALQARGLYGEAPPHETFEEMARDYLVEVRRVQPTGPYLLGGFSGGGLVAFEMARQLLEQGERVDAMILLDTPIREPENFSVMDRIEMWLPGLKAEGPAFLVRKLRERREWRRELEARERTRDNEAAGSLQFHSQRVGDAFLRALARYKVPKLDIPAILLRPKLKAKFRLRDGRLIDTDRNVLKPDNGWSPHVAALRVIEVPGNHDSMVLEPNVRVLTSALRKVLAGTG